MHSTRKQQGFLRVLWALLGMLHLMVWSQEMGMSCYQSGSTGEKKKLVCRVLAARRSWLGQEHTHPFGVGNAHCGLYQGGAQLPSMSMRKQCWS